ncbi:MAG TPA: L-threonylcarbamoyladenylate synthase [Gemmatimonadaceae bacterium]|jgi:L-threonylcarbamoyladenylate synthase
MQLVEIDPVTPDPALIARAAALLRAGRLVAFPTETVYGLGANALDAAAVERIYEAKGRPAYNPLIVHVASAAQVLTVAQEWNDAAERLARMFWPGPLTIVLPKRVDVPNIVSAGLDSVAVRVPAHPVARALLEACGLPIAAPSANRSMMLSPTTGAHVAKSLGDAVDLILDAGPTAVGIESTVIDVTGDRPTLLRPGTITVPEIESAVGPIDIATQAATAAARPSPGMMDRHYSPRARVVIASARDVADIARRERETGVRVGAVVITATPPNIQVNRLPNTPDGYAAQLYGALHALDDAGFDVIIVERVPDSVEWFGVRDRLERASRTG